MTVAITGATGMIGSALVTRLRARGHSVRRLLRSAREPQAGDVVWNPMDDVLDALVLAGCDAVIHLAGAPIAQRWTDSRKREIRESRLRGTTLLANGIASMPRKQRRWAWCRVSVRPTRSMPCWASTRRHSPTTRR